MLLFADTRAARLDSGPAVYLDMALGGETFSGDGRHYMKILFFHYRTLYVPGAILVGRVKRHIV